MSQRTSVGAKTGLTEGRCELMADFLSDLDKNMKNALQVCEGPGFTMEKALDVKNKMIRLNELVDMLNESKISQAEAIEALAEIETLSNALGALS
jgi:hypothetical protein